MIYHEFQRQIQYKFSSSTNEQNSVPSPTKGIAGLHITLILFSCLLINCLVHNVELGCPTCGPRVACGPPRLKIFSNNNLTNIV